MNFHSLNFKIVVINELVALGFFRDEFDSLIDKYWSQDNYSYEPIPEILNFCKNLNLTKDQLSQIKRIVFDGGNAIYQNIIPNWDGEDEYFDIDSIIDIEKLSNLEKIHAISMLNTKDFSPFLKLEKLSFFQLPYKFDDNALKDKLLKKGIELK
jgi:hypothetical protein